MGKTKSLTYLISVFFVAVFCCCNSKSKYAVTPQEFFRLVETENYLVVDVRAGEAYLSGHIEGAATIDFYSPAFEHKFRFLNASKPMALYCKSGKVSVKAIRILESELGFTNMVYLKGGLDAWKEESYTIVKP